MSRKALRSPPISIEHPYLRISFWGAARAHEKYLRLQNICEEALAWLHRQAPVHGSVYSRELDAWLYGSGGFVRPHMPYFVTLTEHEWKVLVYAVRRAGTEDTEYGWMREYASWV